MKRLILNTIGILLIFPLGLFAQTSTWTSNNSGLYIDGTSSLHVDGDIINEDASVIDNAGTIELDRDWVNNNNTNGLLFLNNSPGVVRMTGDMQFITGSDSSNFHHLTLLNNSVIKEMENSASVEGILNLGNAELVLNNNIMHVKNTDPTNAVQWNTGFVSGHTIGGYFARSTDQISDYTFPVGDNALNNIYRAIELTPTNGDTNVFGVRLAATDASFDVSGTSITGSIGPFNRESKGPDVYEVNSEFYHHIARMEGNADAQTQIYFYNDDNVFANEFNGVSYWSNPNDRWDKDVFNLNFSAGRSDIGNPERFMFGTITDFSNDVYALIVKDKITARVPQIFSPNGDGINDILYVLGAEIEDLTFIIYNRWGEKVFETNDINTGWDGTFRSDESQPGVYVYYLKALLSTGETLEQSADITLVR